MHAGVRGCAEWMSGQWDVLWAPERKAVVRLAEEHIAMSAASGSRNFRIQEQGPQVDDQQKGRRPSAIREET